MSRSAQVEIAEIGLVLSPNATEKARTELNEYPTSRQSHIQMLRDKISFKPEFGLRTDDKFLIRFLRTRKFDVDDAFKLLSNYFEVRRNHRELFDGISASSLRRVLEDGFPGVLPGRDQHGCKVVVFFPGRWSLESYSFEDILKALILTMETLIESEETQVNGVAMIVDFGGWKAKHALHVNLLKLKNAIRIFQDCFPARFKGVHFLCQPWYISAITKALKPFIKETTRERIFLHGYNMTTLHEHFNPDYLPADFGGNQPEHDQSSWANVLLAMEKQGQSETWPSSIGKNPFRRTESNYSSYGVDGGMYNNGDPTDCSEDSSVVH